MALPTGSGQVQRRAARRLISLSAKHSAGPANPSGTHAPHPLGVNKTSPKPPRAHRACPANPSGTHKASFANYYTARRKGQPRAGCEAIGKPVEKPRCRHPQPLEPYCLRPSAAATSLSDRAGIFDRPRSLRQAQGQPGRRGPWLRAVNFQPSIRPCKSPRIRRSERHSGQWSLGPRR